MQNTFWLAASVDTAPVLKYNFNGYFSAAIHVSVSDPSIPPLVRADGGIFSLSPENNSGLSLSSSPWFTSEKFNKKPAHLAVGGLEIVLIDQVKIYPLTSFVPSSSPVLGLYFTSQPNERARVPCKRRVAKDWLCCEVRVMAFMEMECAYLI